MFTVLKITADSFSSSKSKQMLHYVLEELLLDWYPNMTFVVYDDEEGIPALTVTRGERDDIALVLYSGGAVKRYHVDRNQKYLEITSIP